jgi:hypothetical protein
MHREHTVSIPDPRVVIGLSLTSIGMMLALGIAGGERMLGLLAFVLRVYAMGSHVAVDWLSHHLQQVVLGVGISWALMAGAGVWMLWRLTHPVTDVHDRREVTHGS